MIKTFKTVKKISNVWEFNIYDAGITNLGCVQAHIPE